MADNKPAVLGGTAIKPKERHGWEAVRYLIHNPETGEYLTRTPKSWLLIFVFYVIYYSCLAGFWAAMLNIFFLTLPDGQPKWTTDSSIIGKSPGLGLRPRQADADIDSSMIQFSLGQNTHGDLNNYQHWVDQTGKFLEAYKDSEQLNGLGACATAPYGYDTGKPCIFLKLNRIIDLINEPFLEDTDIPDGMPEDLKTHIKNQGDRNQVWVNCRGQYAADTEAMGRLKYFPDTRGFPNKEPYFPYKGNAADPTYESPIVAVQFEAPKQNQLIHVECRAWAKNIGYDKRDRVGINLFELHILDDTAAAAIVAAGK